ncbi:hypothetical protein D3C87_716770 [compost metagenome]
MTLDVEKAPFAAGVVDLFGHRRPGVFVVAIERADINDRKTVHARVLKKRRLENTEELCGSWLASDEAIKFNINVACQTAIAGKPAPTGSVCFAEDYFGISAFMPST